MDRGRRARSDSLREACPGFDVLYNLFAEHRDNVEPAERQLTISSVRVKKYASSTQFAANRVLGSGFRPRHSLHEALVDTIRHEFVDAPPRATPSPATPKP